MSYEYLMSEIESYNAHNPRHIWNYVNNDDIFVSEFPLNGGNNFIIGVNRYDNRSHTLDLNFIYTISEDDFEICDQDDCADPSFVERYPYKWEVEKLYNNIDFRIYLSNNLK